MNTMWIR